MIMLLTSENSAFPRGILIAAGSLLAFTLVAAGLASVAGFAKADIPVVKPIEIRTLRFEDRRDGAVTVFDGAQNRLIAVLAPGTNGFVRGVMRGLARARKRSDIDDSPSFVLTHWADGRLSLEDPTTHQAIELEAFGPTNVGVFARLIDKRNDLP
jgi:putative photosynthetic complex assembly protein